MSRALSWIEAAGIPAVGIACQGFATTVRLTARFEGLASVRLVEYPPPNLAVHNAAEVYEYATHLADGVVAALTTASAPEEAAQRPVENPTAIVFKGDLHEVNDFVVKNVWSDGLPVIPPTIEQVQAMLAYTDRSPEEVVGVLPPKRCEATVWKIAVNGVMAGCRPEYMPILLAITEAIADPRFGLEHGGSTVGWTPLIILNGPIIEELGFNCGQGVMRPQNRANVTVARFLRLCMVNIAGFRLGETDMATFGRNYYPVLAEAEKQSPWPPLSVDRGFALGANVVTVQSADATGDNFLTVGEAAEHLRVIARETARALGGSHVYAMEHFGGEVSPVVCVTPLVAGIIAKAGYSKKDVQRYLFEHALIPAHEFDDQLNIHQRGLNLHDSVKAGKLPQIFAVSADPNRLVPVVHRADEFMIVVSGSPSRNRNFVAPQIADQGLSVSKEIRLPARWRERLATGRTR